MAKLYSDTKTYENKLKKVMDRLGVDKYDYNWDRYSCWVEFIYKNQKYKFEHSISNAKDHGVNLQYGSDVFAQVVLTLEDIARMTERGIYELNTWLQGLKALPKPKNINNCFKILGFNDIPTHSELKERYRRIAKTAHPDKGGDKEYFSIVNKAYQEANDILNQRLENF